MCIYIRGWGQGRRSRRKLILAPSLLQGGKNLHSIEWNRRSSGVRSSCHSKISFTFALHWLLKTYNNKVHCCKLMNYVKASRSFVDSFGLGSNLLSEEN